MEIFTHITKKHLVLATILFIAIFVFYTAKYISDNLLFQPHGTATIYSAPFDVVVKHHKTTKKVSSSAKGVEIPLPVGEYDISFSAKGFSDYTKHVSVKDKGSYKIAFQLTPITDEARRDIEENSSKYDPIYQSVYAVERDEYMRDNPNPLGNSLVGKLPYYGGKSYSIKVCSHYRDSLVDGQTRVGICIETLRDEPLLITDSIGKLEELLDTDIEKYDVKINGFIYPTREEIENGLVYDCSTLGLSFCYLYNEPGSAPPHL